MKRMNESPEVSHLLDTFICPQCSAPSLKIIDKQFGRCESGECDYEGKVKTRVAKPPHEDQTMCVIIDNQLYCVEKDDLEAPLVRVEQENED